MHCYGALFPLLVQEQELHINASKIQNGNKPSFFRIVHTLENCIVQSERSVQCLLPFLVSRSMWRKRSRCPVASDVDALNSCSLPPPPLHRTPASQPAARNQQALASALAVAAVRFISAPFAAPAVAFAAAAALGPCPVSPLASVPFEATRSQSIRALPLSPAAANRLEALASARFLVHLGVRAAGVLVRLLRLICKRN